MQLIQLSAIIFIVSIVVSLASEPLAIKVASYFDAIDYPNARRVNTQPIPRMGGICIFIALSVSVTVLFLLLSFFPHFDIGFELRPGVNASLLVSSIVLMFVLGSIDDVLHISAKFKLIGQILVALLGVRSGLIIQYITLPAIGTTLDLGYGAIVFTVFIMVSFTNAINLIDGLDGLAAGYSLIASVVLFILSLLKGLYFVALFFICLIGSLVGFLKFNLHPAKLFLGDSGSLLIGYLFGVVYLYAWNNTVSLDELIAVLILFAVPITDTACAIIRRRRQRINIGHPDKGHVHHRLLAAGADQWRAVAHIYFWALILAVLSIWFDIASVYVRYAILISVVFGVIFIVTKYEIAKPLNQFSGDEVSE